MHERGEVAYKIMTLTPEKKMPLGIIGVNRSRALK
jgi:hypothetical protein